MSARSDAYRKCIREFSASLGCVESMCKHITDTIDYSDCIDSLTEKEQTEYIAVQMSILGQIYEEMKAYWGDIERFGQYDSKSED